MRKAELMGISTDIFPVDTSDANASIDGRRKHKQPALSAEFVNYYLGEQNQNSLFPFKIEVFTCFESISIEDIFTVYIALHYQSPLIDVYYLLH